AETRELGGPSTGTPERGRPAEALSFRGGGDARAGETRGARPAIRPESVPGELRAPCVRQEMVSTPRKNALALAEPFGACTSGKNGRRNEGRGMWSRASAADEVGRSLLEEGADALAVVLGAEELGERGGDPATERVPVGIEGLAQAGLEPAHGERRVGGDAVGEGQRRRHQLLVRHHPADEADAQGLGGVDDVPGEQQLGRLLAADELG